MDDLKHLTLNPHAVWLVRAPPMDESVRNQKGGSAGQSPLAEACPVLTGRDAGEL